jgi:hypothetical protein
VFVPYIQLKSHFVAAIRDRLAPYQTDVFLFVTSETDQGLPLGYRGKAFLLSENNAMMAIIDIQDLKKLSEEEYQLKVSLVRVLTQEEREILHDLWYDLRG